MGWDFTPYFLELNRFLEYLRYSHNSDWLLILLILLTPFGGVVWVKGLYRSMLVHRVWHGVAKSYDTFLSSSFPPPLLFLLDSLKHVFLSTILPWSLASYCCLFLMLTLLVFDGCCLVHATSEWPVRHLCLKLHTLRYLCFAPLCIGASHSFFCLC